MSVYILPFFSVPFKLSPSIMIFRRTTWTEWVMHSFACTSWTWLSRGVNVGVSWPLQGQEKTCLSLSLESREKRWNKFSNTFEKRTREEERQWVYSQGNKRVFRTEKENKQIRFPIKRQKSNLTPINRLLLCRSLKSYFSLEKNRITKQRKRVNTNTQHDIEWDCKKHCIQTRHEMQHSS